MSRKSPTSRVAAETTIGTTAAAATSQPAPPRPKLIPGGDLLSLDFDELSEILGGTGRARMVWSALSAGVDPFGDATEFLTDKTAAVLKDTFEGLPWQVVRESVSSCGTRKLLIRLEDGLEVETVVIPDLSGARCDGYQQQHCTRLDKTTWSKIRHTYM